MRIYFLGIGGTAIGPLAMIAKQSGYEVFGSDKQNSDYIKNLKKFDIEDIYIGNDADHISGIKGIDLVVYSSAVSIEQPNHPVLEYAKEHRIKAVKRDELLNLIIKENNLKLIAVAGTHGKTTTTAMVIWIFKQLGIPISYSVGAKIPFGEMGEFNPSSKYFVYEADEFDRNFLYFNPFISVITGIDWDHPDIYPTREDYYQAFKEFLGKSQNVVSHPEDMDKLGLASESETVNVDSISLTGQVNRMNAQLAVQAVSQATEKDSDELIKIINKFPGLSRRFEKISQNIYSDYAHTPKKIRGALQMAKEVAGDNVIVVYEGLHNTRQHFIKGELPDLFNGVKKLYVVPSYLAREDKNLELLTPQKLCEIIKKPEDREAAELNSELKNKLKEHAENNDLVLCLTAGGGGSLDEWLRQNF